VCVMQVHPTAHTPAIVQALTHNAATLRGDLDMAASILDGRIRAATRDRDRATVATHTAARDALDDILAATEHACTRLLAVLALYAAEVLPADHHHHELIGAEQGSS